MDVELVLIDDIAAWSYGERLQVLVPLNSVDPLLAMLERELVLGPYVLKDLVVRSIRGAVLDRGPGTKRRLPRFDAGGYPGY